MRVTEIPESSAEAAPEEVVAAPDEEPASAEAAVAAHADEPMVVTGTRIRRKDLTGATPVVVFSREQLVASGRANVGEFLQMMPEQSNAINRGVNNAGDGSIRVNLRGIGAQSTLVLLNGRRLAPGGTGGDRAPDLSAIPTNVIERIEILKDGASAVYGSDAIAGVVNIVTRKRFDGAEANIYGSTSTKGDGGQIDANATIGVTGQKGNLLVSLGYYNAAPAWVGNRDYSSVARGYQFNPDGTGEAFEFGSGTVPGSRIVLGPREVGVPNGNANYNKLVQQYPNANSFLFDQNTRAWRDFKGSALSGDGWNYQPYNYLLTPQQRFNIFSSGDYQISKPVRAFFDAYYTKRNSKQTLAPEPLQLDLEGVTVSGQSVYNPFGRDFTAVRRRLLEFDRRGFQQDIHNFHLTAGIDGDLSDAAGGLAGWFWEAVFGFSRNEATEIRTGNLRNTRIQNAVGPSFVDEAGSPRCGTPGAAIEGCVPLNLMDGPGSITRDQVDYLTYTGIKRGYNQIIGGQFNTSGPLFRLWSANEVRLALGYEFRALSGGYVPDPITAAGETSGNKELPTGGKYHVHEIYAELNIPVVEKLPLLETLELIAAGRGSFYSNFGDTFNYKLGARWSPLEDITLRGSYSTAFRAPNITELYQGAADTFANVTDPCQTVEPGTALARNCGAAANNGDDQTQLRSRVGGNANLRAEKARIFTLGVVLRPRKAKNISLTVDYFHTKITQTISSVGENVILQGCYPSADGTAPTYCQFISRDPVTQRINYIDNLQANSGEELLDGVDISGRYDLDLPVGSFSLLTAVAYLHRYDRRLADGTVIHGAGTFDLNSKNPTGSGYAGAFPHFRFNVGLNWAMNGWSASLRTFFIGSYKECGDSAGELVGAGLCSTEHLGERWVDPYNTWDLMLGYAFKSGAGRTSVSIGATNIFNAAPPRVYNGFANTTDAYTYDMLMRQVYARVGHQF